MEAKKNMITQAIFEQIANLCEMGSNVIKVDEEYFTFLSFESSSSASTQSVDFCMFTGICITEFITSLSYHIGARKENFYQQFEKYITPKTALTVKFNKYTNYIIFTQR